MKGHPYQVQLKSSVSGQFDILKGKCQMIREKFPEFKEPVWSEIFERMDIFLNKLDK